MPTGIAPVHKPGGWMVPSVPSRLAIALGLTVGLVMVEAAAGIMANSLVLLTDAAHNLTDVAALALSLLALKLQARPASPQRTYGFHRVGILVAIVNSTTLIAISIMVLVEAHQRILQPPSVQAWTLIVVGSAAFVVNLGTALLIRRPGESDLNLQSTFLHLMGDVASTAAALVAGVGIYLTGATWLDPVASAIMAVLILVGAWRVLREAIGILLEATPSDVDMRALVGHILGIPGVLGLHDLHVWSLSKNVRAMSAHILTDDSGLMAGDRIRNEITRVLASTYNVAHSTLQLESAACGSGDLFCTMEASAPTHAG